VSLDDLASREGAPAGDTNNKQPSEYACSQSSKRMALAYSLQPFPEVTIAANKLRLRCTGSESAAV
jgi:hypothetical protein